MNNSLSKSNEEMKFESVHFFYPPNIRFAKGLTKWTASGKKQILESIAATCVVIVVLVTLISRKFLLSNSVIEIIVISVVALLFIIMSIFLCRKIVYEQNLTAKGTLSLGKVVQCKFVRRGSDNFDTFEVKYIFNETESSFQVPLAKAARDIVGKSILVLHIDQKNCSVL